MDENNIICLSDGYKVSHYKQYPPKTKLVYSYFESRGGVFQQTVFFGLQYFLKKYLCGEVVTKEKIFQASQLFERYFGDNLVFNAEGWNYILEKHHGKLPVRIKAVPEGMVVPTSNVLMTIENLDPNCYWLVNYLETLLVQVWYTSAVATYSREIRKLILKYLIDTGDPGLISFKLHDFGFRGVSSVESAGEGGLAHLVNFLGTDTVQALVYADNYYNLKAGEVAGYTIPASEHSTITSWGREREKEACENMIEQYGHMPMFACVSDSYDIFNACERIWGKELKDKILKMNATLVIRPDSGYPPEIIRKILIALDTSFGSSLNEKGYKVLNPKVRVIQGDGVNLEMIDKILSTMKEMGFSADNIAFGSGGALLQKHDRDGQKFAFKCSFTENQFGSIDVYKDPITDKGKMSKKGTLKLVEIEGSHGKTVKTITSGISAEKDLLETVFNNGELVKDQSLSEVRQRALAKTISEAY